MIDNKYKLGFLPTPLHKLNNLSKNYPDYNIFIKKYDPIGLEYGGNNVGKLKYLVKQVIEIINQEIVPIFDARGTTEYKHFSGQSISQGTLYKFSPKRIKFIHI